MEVRKSLLEGCKVEKNFMIFFDIPLENNGTILRTNAKNDRRYVEFISIEFFRPIKETLINYFTIQYHIYFYLSFYILLIFVYNYTNIITPD